MTKAKMKGKVFKDSEIISILSKQKTQFREVIRPQPRKGLEAKLRKNKQGNLVCMEWARNEDQVMRFTGLGMDICKAPYQVGEKIKPRPKSGSIHLQLKLFDVELEITSIRVERLQDISEENAIAEGFEGGCCQDFFYLYNESLEETKYCCKFDLAKRQFKHTWNATHKKPEEKWEANPWVFVYQFKLIK
jgi:hypothetical protein